MIINLRYPNTSGLVLVTGNDLELPIITNV